MKTIELMKKIIKEAAKLVKKETKVEEVKPVEDLIKKKLIEDIEIFLKSIRGKASLPREQIKIMYDLHNKYYGTHEKDYSCSICAARIYVALKKIFKK